MFFFWKNNTTLVLLLFLYEIAVLPMENIKYCLCILFVHTFILVGRCDMANLMDNLDDMFENYLSGSKIFKNRDTMRPSYVPRNLPHRNEKALDLGRILAPSLRGEIPSNALLYGKPGTGKTAVTQYVLQKMDAKCVEAGIPLTSTYFNCQLVDTNYRVLTFLCQEIGVEVPITGLPTVEVYSRFTSALDAKNLQMIIILDEIDALVKKSGSEVLYSLTRINSDLERGKVSLVGISNDTRFKEFLDPRVLSSLSEEEIVFPAYNAIELGDILWERALISFNEDVIDEGVIGLCAALAAKEHGDARRALDLLRVAGEVAERSGSQKVIGDHVKEAQRVIERNMVEEVIKTLPLQSKLVLFSIYLLEKENLHNIYTGQLYNTYHEVSRKMRVESLTQRRISDLINELDMMGIINAEVISRGRGGRTRKINLSIPIRQLKSFIENDIRFSDYLDFIP